VEEAHVQRVQQLCSQGQRPEFPPRRGLGQQPRRRCEQALRGHVAALSMLLQARGYTRVERAALLQLAPRTLRQWDQDFRGPLLLPPLLGRPVQRAARADRQAVLELLADLGPLTGLPTLCACFPALLRAELADLLGRYRRVWRRRYHAAVAVLTWLVPGAVWAMDFSEAPRAIDGLFPYLFAVRDLASGQQLLWLPVRAADGDAARRALAALFAWHGAPFVLKSANGSAFTAEATRGLLDEAAVMALFSPPYYPQYNGAIEAGIGSLATRTERHAARHDRAGFWTGDDVAAAQAEANATARPRGPAGPTPAQAWATRSRLTIEQRRRLAEAVERYRQEERLQAAGPRAAGPLGEQEERAMERHAIERALVEHGYLLFRRRRIPLPFTRKKVTRIT
jgi:transposase InsO family protein